MPKLSAAVIALFGAAFVAALGVFLTVLDVGDKIGSPNRRNYAAVLFLVFVVCLGGAVWQLFQRIEKLECDKGDLEQKLQQRYTNQALAERLLVLLQKGIHDVANMTVDPHDFDEVQKFTRAAHAWLTEVRAVMVQGGCMPWDLSVVTDFTAADIPAPESLGYFFPSNAFLASSKAMFAMRLKGLRRVIDNYAEVKVLAAD